jgi:hypothetical protein
MPTDLEHLSGPIPGYSFSHFLVAPSGNTNPQYIGPHHHFLSAGSPNTNNTPRYMPIRLSRRFRATAMVTELTLLGTDPNEVTRLGLYSHDMERGFPSALIRDFGTIQSGQGSTGFRETPAGLGIDLDAGTYWVCELTSTTLVISQRRNYSGSCAYMWTRSAPLSFIILVGLTGQPMNDASFLPGAAVIGGSTGGGGMIYLKGVGI